MLCSIIKEGSKVAGKAFFKSIKEIIFRDELTPVEAKLILDVKSNASKIELEENFKNMYKLNSLENGGSLYLQEKILHSYELLKKKDKF